MKPAGKFVAAAVLVGLMASSFGAAQAGPYYHHGGGGYRHSSGGFRWVAPAIAGGLLTYALMQPRVVYAQPPVTVVPSPVVVAPPPPPLVVGQSSTAAVYYFCDSAQNYYPYVQACPEGWKVLPATPVR